MHEDEEQKEERLSKLMADASLKIRRLSSLREKLLCVELEEYEELIDRYGGELRETIKDLEEVLSLDERGGHRHLHMAICFAIFDSMFHPDRIFPFPLIRDEDVWKALDTHCMETLQLIEEFFKRIIALHADTLERPDFSKELKIYTDRDRLNTFVLFEVCKLMRPEDPDIWHLMGIIYKDLARYGKHKEPLEVERYLNLAEKYLAKTVELDPKRGDAWSSLAKTY
jgi:tetratricopeptide (TPR) repeat protein